VVFNFVSISIREGIMTNNEFRKDKIFCECCKRMSILPTARQASKFRRGNGLAVKALVTVRREMKLNETRK